MHSKSPTVLAAEINSDPTEIIPLLSNFEKSSFVVILKSIRIR